MTIELNGASLQEGIMDGLTLLEVYVGSELIWPTAVRITLGDYLEAQNQLLAALAARGLDYQTVTEIPFDIELVGSGTTRNMFAGYASLTSVPIMDTSQVTDMRSMFYGCTALTYVPDLDTAQVTNMSYMFYNCAALTDGNVRLIGKHPSVDTMSMIAGSGLTREPFDVIIEVHQVSVTDVRGSSTLHSLLNVTVPSGETWQVRIQGTMTKAYSITSSQPQVRIGGTTFGPYAQGAVVDVSGTVTRTNSTIAIFTRSNTISRSVSFVGTVTIEK